jgi:mRNA-degrading endonuclease RelE of RelBE toxin-antitoxin system
MRTTIDIDDPILRDLKRLQKREGKSLGRLISDLLARSLAAERSAPPLEAPVLRWHSQAMRSKIDLADKQARLDAMDQAPGERAR